MNYFIDLFFGIRKGRQSMYKLIKNDHIVANGWKTLTLTESDNPDSVRLPVGPVLVPLSVWQARRAELIHREYEHGWPLGIWLASEEDAEAIENDIEDFTVIAVAFEKLADSNGYSTARLLRERYGYKSELRAIGNVPRDKLSKLDKAGFDAFAVNDYKNDGVVLSGWFDLNSANQSGRLSVVAG
jgi:uncharacterized protein (DUF934 family)